MSICYNFFMNNNEKKINMQILYPDNFEEFIDTFHRENLLNKSNDVLSEIISNPNNGHTDL